MKKIKLFLWSMMLLLILVELSSAVDSTAIFNAQYSGFSGAYSGLMNGPSISYAKGTSEDFYDVAFMIPPLGCQPYVVRSDLLEEQNVPVFCQLVPLKLSLGLDISRIESIHITQKENNPYVAGVGFYPANAAVKSLGTSINNPTLDNIGYVVVVLKRHDTEQTMPEMVNVTLAARIQFRAENAYGIGESEYYVPVLSQEDFENQYVDYSFFDGIGYLQVKDINEAENSATVAVYSTYGKSDSNLRQVFSAKLEEGKTSNDFYINNYFGGQGLRIMLKSLSSPEAKAKIKVNGETYEVFKNQRFYGNKCSLLSITPSVGGAGKVTLSCGSKSFTLEKKISNIELEIPGRQIKKYALGEEILVAGDYAYYLVYAGKENKENFVSLAKVKLNDLPKDSVSKENFITNLQKQVEVNVKKTMTTETITLNGKNIGIIKIPQNKQEPGTEIKFTKSTTSDKTLSPNAEKYFDKALEAYDYTEANFGQETFKVEGRTYGEQALWEEYKLALNLDQKEKVTEILSRIMNQYPKSSYSGNKAEDLFENLDLLSSDQGTSYYSEQEALTVQLLSVDSPKLNEAGADLTLSYNNLDYSQGVYHAGDTLVNENGVLVKLTAFDKTKVYLSYTCKTTNERSISKNISGSGTIVINDCNTQIKINELSMNKIANLKIIPIFRGSSRESNFSFAIGIEKRAFSLNLTPEEANEKIKKLQDQIDQYKNISESLAKIIEADKIACLATSAYVNLKNLFQGRSGEATARREVMEKWNKLCEAADFQQRNQVGNVEDCINKNSDTIDKEVSEMTEILKNINNQIAEAEKGSKDEQGVVNYEASLNKLVGEFQNQYGTSAEAKLGKTNIEGSSINTIIKNIDAEKDISNSELSSLKKNMAIVDAGTSKFSQETVEQAKEEVLGTLLVIKNRQSERSSLSGLQSQFGEDAKVYIFTDRNALKTNYVPQSWQDFKKDKAFVGAEGISEEDLVALVYPSNTDGKTYLAVLDGDLKTKRVKTWYEIASNSPNGYLLTKKESRDLSTNTNLVFNVVDKSTYSNKCRNCNYMKVFALEPNKGKPALLPFDDVNGWYVEIKQNTPGLLGGDRASYQSSGIINSYWLCNVGSDGLMEGVNIDECQRFDYYTGMQSENLLGLEESQARAINKQAITAIKSAQNQLMSNPSKIRISGIRQNNGELKVLNYEGESGGKCTDYMSAKDCRLLFNVCDPVVCPSSRCDLGGKFKVDNVIQSGIVGSTLLCLPNFIGFDKETGVIVPVCLTGINAGIESWISILESYKSCLNESASSGKAVGVCDTIHSVYVCDFFWRQVGPFANAMLKNLFLGIFGKKESKGGGEYMFVQDAWNNAENSMSYFKTSYGKDSKLSFGVKELTNSIVADVCKSPMSATYPDSFDAMLEPESPYQFHAFFDEIPYTDATVPARSQYKVFYHIYAGNDKGRYFQVYLKDAPETYGYLSKDIQVIASGYVAKGETRTETKDFLDISGFKQLCVRIDYKDECGFKSVSTSALLDYAKDVAVSRESERSITSESECISGGANVGALLTPNIQQAAEQLANPESYNQGIIRVCSSKNPGSTTSGDRWKNVGYCDNTAVRCWLDTNSVKKAISGKGLENSTLSEIENMDLQSKINQGYYGSDKAAEEIVKLKNEFQGILKGVDSGDINEGLLESLDSKVSDLQFKFAMTADKAALWMFKGDVYGKVALIYNKNPEKTQTIQTIVQAAISGVAGKGDEAVEESRLMEVDSQENLILARMIQGEEASQGQEAMYAAGWVAINRLNDPEGRWGSNLKAVITAENQFQGYNPKIAPSQNALTIAKDILGQKNKVPLEYSGFYYFGNGDSVKDSMVACKDYYAEEIFSYLQVGDTNLYLSNLDYTVCISD